MTGDDYYYPPFFSLKQNIILPISSEAIIPGLRKLLTIEGSVSKECSTDHTQLISLGCGNPTACSSCLALLVAQCMLHDTGHTVCVFYMVSPCSEILSWKGKRRQSQNLESCRDLCRGCRLAIQIDDQLRFTRESCTVMITVLFGITWMKLEFIQNWLLSGTNLGDADPGLWWGGWRHGSKSTELPLHQTHGCGVFQAGSQSACPQVQPGKGLCQEMSWLRLSLW